MANPIQILCEVDPLKKVIVHRPGNELLHLIPDNLEKLLFDDLLYLEKAQEEHDIFTEALKRENVEVIFLEDLMSDILENDRIRHSFIEDYILEAKIPAIHDRKRVQALLSAINNPKVLIEKTMSGILKSELAAAPADHLSSLTADGYPFITDPMVNLYFARDAFCLSETAWQSVICVMTQGHGKQSTEGIFCDTILCCLMKPLGIIMMLI